MANCSEAHAQYDPIANGDGQVGSLPDWLRVQGKVFWWVHQGAYQGLGAAWTVFHAKAAGAGVRPAGPPGEVYVCDPDDHRDRPEEILTLLWIPVE